MKKGFTLIELLAVIVILAIIALIATPAVIDVISETKESSLLRSAHFYLSGVELSIYNSTLEQKSVKDGTYEILENGNICLEYNNKVCSDILEIDVNGKIPKGGIVTIINGEIRDISLNLDNKDITTNDEGKLVYQTKESALLKSAQFYLDVVEFTIAGDKLNNEILEDGTYEILENGNICLEYNNKVCSDILEIDVNGNIPEEGGIITVEEGAIKSAYLVYKGENIAINSDGNVYFRKACVVVSGDGTKLGDEIECAGEHFYVISNDGNKISMLSKYNLDVGNNLIADLNGNILSDDEIENPTVIQKEEAKGAFIGSTVVSSYGVLEFSNTNYWYDGSNSSLKEEYGTSYPAWVYTDKFSNIDAENIIYSHVNYYENYLNKKGVSSAEATLISYEQLVQLGCDSNKSTCGPDIGKGSLEKPAPAWVYSTSYWSGSASDKSNLYCVFSFGRLSVLGYNNESNLGVRPVVNISTSEI